MVKKMITALKVVIIFYQFNYALVYVIGHKYKCFKHCFKELDFLMLKICMLYDVYTCTFTRYMCVYICVCVYIIDMYVC
jgi:hypothetical protein